MKTLTEDQIERTSVEQVFCLTGGELNSKSLTYDGGTFRYTYDGVPEYAVGIDFAKRNEQGDWFTDTHFTAVVCCLYGAPPEVINVDGVTYTLAATYRSSGETECCCVGCDEDPFLGVTCPYCDRSAEERAAEGHGYIYIGDGWCELVYAKAFVDSEVE